MFFIIKNEINFCNLDHFKNRLAKLLSRRHHIFESNSHFYSDHHVQFNKKDKEDKVELKSVLDTSSPPLSVQDLLNFAFQCASGMQYLASKKVKILLLN